MFIPAIDLKGGQVVQLVQGKRLALASDDIDAWVRKFAHYSRVQLIDLDGALETGANDAIVRRICAQLPCRVGGGVRTIARAEALIGAGAQQVIVSSALFKNGRVDLAFARALADAVGIDRVIAAVDSAGGKVVIRGWTEATALSAVEAVRELEPFCGGFLYTHVDTEGLMQGIDMDAVRAVRAATAKSLTAAGGIRTREEILALDALGIDAVVGMAVYTGALSLDNPGPPARDAQTPDAMITRAALPGRLFPARQSRRRWPLALILALASLAGCSRQSDVPFRVDNARAHLDRLTDAGPRPTGSAANAAARAYLVDQLRLYGFDVRTQTVDASRPEYGRTMRVTNIVATRAGSRQDAIALVAHYDSVPIAPGAMDDGIGTAVALEAGTAAGRRRRRLRHTLRRAPHRRRGVRADGRGRRDERRRAARPPEGLRQPRVDRIDRAGDPVRIGSRQRGADRGPGPAARRARTARPTRSRSTSGCPTTPTSRSSSRPASPA